MSLNIDKNGRIFAVECIIFQDDSFEISINDITQEKEQALLKKQLTQNIAHELKTPVSSIQGYLETIVNNPTLPREKINAFLERSYAQSNRLAHLLRDISVLTRMEEAPNMIETEPVNLTTMMRNILNEVTLELEEKQITAHNMLPEGLTIQGNSSLLYSIFRNLTDNAIAYAGTHISITIRCFREDERFLLFQFLGHRRRSRTRTSKPFVRAFLSGGQRTFTQIGRYRTGTSYCKKTQSFCMAEQSSLKIPPVEVWNSYLH